MFSLAVYKELTLLFFQLYSGPELHHEVKGLVPFSTYSFKVLAVNSAGIGAFSGVTSVTTPAASPGIVNTLKHTSETNTLKIQWQEPADNGSPIQAYHIELVGTEIKIDVEKSCECVVQNLEPNTHYK